MLFAGVIYGVAFTVGGFLAWAFLEALHEKQRESRAQLKKDDEEWRA